VCISIKLCEHWRQLYNYSIFAHKSVNFTFGVLYIVYATSAVFSSLSVADLEGCRAGSAPPLWRRTHAVTHDHVS